MQSIRPLIPLIAFALSCPVWAAGPSPAALASTHVPDTGSAEVNPYTGTDLSIANLKKELEIERLKTLIADEKQRQKRSASESRKLDQPDVLPRGRSEKFSTLGFPTDKMPELEGVLFPGMKVARGMKAKQPPPSNAVAPAAPVAAPLPVVPTGPRLVGVIRDESGQVAIIELGGVLKQASASASAHGLKVTQIGDGWAEVGGKRLVQDSSTLALVTNVDKQPVARLAAGGGMNTAPASSGQPVAQAMPFTPPSFQ